MSTLVDVVLPLPFDRTFTYRVPSSAEGKVLTGTRLRVPFGKKSMVGVAVAFPRESSLKEIKDVSEILDREPFLTGDLWKTVQWISDYYACSLGEAAAACLPPVLGGDARAPSLVVLARAPDPGEPEWETLARRAPRQAELVELLQARGGSARRDEVLAWGLGSRVLRELTRKGWVRLEKEAPQETRTESPHELTADQSKAFGRIRSSLHSRTFSAYLLQGITGSGKTEVYLRAMEEALHTNRSVIFLVPEIALAPQTSRRIERRFGGRMGVLHSRLSGAERYEIWKKARAGEIKIVVGARSAVFAPFSDLGLVVVDEEHDSSYKQGEKPRYHARNVALVRARHAGATAVLGSATPSLESLENARRGKLTRLELRQRVGGGTLPSVRLVDLTREEWVDSDTFSSDMIDSIRSRLDRREQVILLLNRRGHSNFLQCAQCGWVKKCDRCDITLTYHRIGAVLLCHYCGRREVTSLECPDCGSGRISHRGFGTQRVEQELAHLFPEARCERMDVDTTRGKRSIQEILDRFAAGETDILFGTQMVAKGHHFPRVSLVGVLGADQGLNFPDFRAGERLLQLLLQVSGRAGRREIPGEVLIQTFTPEHPVFEAARDHAYEPYMFGEMRVRHSLGYPPAVRLAALTISGPVEATVVRAAENVAGRFRRFSGGNAKIMGPVAAVLPRIRGRHRWQILIKGNLSTHAKRELLQRAEAGTRSVPGGSRLDLVFDVDPESIL